MTAKTASSFGMQGERGLLNIEEERPCFIILLFMVVIGV
jgi:hypothetical protein